MSDSGSVTPALTLYQVEFFNGFMESFRRGSVHLLRAPVGWGKTFMVASVVSRLAREGPASRFLVVTTSSALAEQWAYILVQWSLKPLVLTGPKLRLLREEYGTDVASWPAGVVVINAATAARADASALLSAIPWDLVIADAARASPAQLSIIDGLAASPHRPMLLMLSLPGISWPSLPTPDVVHEWTDASRNLFGYHMASAKALLRRRSVEYERTAEDQALCATVLAVARNLPRSSGRALLTFAASSNACLDAGVARMAAAEHLSPAMRQGLEDVLSAVAEVSIDARQEQLKAELVGFFVATWAEPQQRRALVLVEERATAEYIVAAWEGETFLLHADVPAEDRRATLARFLGGDGVVLVATDAGLDGASLGAVQFVVHYDLPLSVRGFAEREARYGKFERVKPCEVVLLHDGSGSSVLEELQHRTVSKYDIAGVPQDGGELDLDALLDGPE